MRNAAVLLIRVVGSAAGGDQAGPALIKVLWSNDAEPIRLAASKAAVQ